MTDKMEVTQADPLSVACRKCFQGIGKVCCGVRRAHRVRYLDAQAMQRGDADEYTEWRERIENLRAAHSGEGRSYGAGEDALSTERKTVLQNKRVNDAIQTALERGELTITSNGYLAALTPQGDGEVERLVHIFRELPLHGDAGCDKLTDEEWRQVARAALNPAQATAVSGKAGEGE